MEETINKVIEIYTESSPNPNSLKFVTDALLLAEGSVDFPDDQSAVDCEIASDLFKFSFIKRVFITSNFITVTKSNDIDWYEAAPLVKALIKGYLLEGKPLFKENVKLEGLLIDENDPEIVGKIKMLLEEYVKPAVEQDGGAIYFKSYYDGVVNVVLQGSCSGCPSSTITLKAGIENLFKRMIPEIKEVVAVNE